MVHSSTDETLARVSQAVWETVAEEGIEATSVRQVAHRAECTTGLIMHHFGSREAMLTHARQLLYERTAARADAAEEAIAAPRQRLIEVLAGPLTLDEDRRQEARVWMGFAAAALPQENMRGLHVTGNRSWLTRVTRLLGECVPEADPALVHRSALRLVALVEGLGALSSLDPETYTASAQIAALTEEIDTVLGLAAQV